MQSISTEWPGGKKKVLGFDATACVGFWLACESFYIQPIKASSQPVKALFLNFCLVANIGFEYRY